MKRKSLICFLITSVFLLAITACAPLSRQDTISQALGLDVSKGEEVSHYDTHSGNGDGTSCFVLRFSDKNVLEQIQESAQWNAFPMDEIVTALVYGISDDTSSIGPFLSDENGEPLVPDIQQGYYLLLDRQTVADQSETTDILQRASFNFTLALYDTQTDTLYYCELDT